MNGATAGQRGLGLGRGGPRPPQAQATPQPSHPSCPGAGGGPAGSPQREQEQSSARAPRHALAGAAPGARTPLHYSLQPGGKAGGGPAPSSPCPIVNPAALPPAPGSSTWAESPAAGLLGTRSRSPNSGSGRLGSPPVVPGRHSPFHRGAPGFASGPRPSPPGAARQPSCSRRTAAGSSGLRELVRARRAAAVTCAEAARAAVGGAGGRGRESAAPAVGASGGGGLRSGWGRS